MFEVDAFVADCQAALADTDRVGALRAVLDRVGSDPGAVAAVMGEPSCGGLTVLHRSPELTVQQVVWTPGMAIGAHDHRMLAGIVVFAGHEDNAFFRRRGDRVEQASGRRLEEGDAYVMGDDVIHAVHGHDDRYTGALHVYAGDFFDRERSMWFADGTPDPCPPEVVDIFERAEREWRERRGGDEPAAPPPGARA
jgi:predicted metal-dependent enzyme (double-stranded beta helix superfamily)